jgi:DNA-binding NtrC family response regulator
VNASSHQETLLIVEADIRVRMAVAAYLRECGYTVIEASNTDEALGILQSHYKVDVAFIDAEASGKLDGFGLAQWIRANASTKIVLTSGVHRTAENAGDLCKHGPMLIKPYDHRNLEQHIRRLLATRP